MPWINRLFAMAFAVALIPALSHCGDDGSSTGDDDDDDDDMMDAGMGTDGGEEMPELVSIALSSDAFTLEVGATQALTVTGTYDDASTETLTEGIGWSSSMESVATVDTNGIVTAVGAGTSMITAAVDGLTAVANATVEAAANSDVIFDDDYGPGVGFVGFGGSTNDLSITTAEFYEGTSSLRMPVPGAGYTGGTFTVGTPRDASSYDAVSFWAKVDAGPHTIDVVGIGDRGDGPNRYKTERRNLSFTTEWQNFLIPLPNPAKFDGAVGLFHIAEGTEGAYVIFLDEIRFVNLEAGTVTNPRPAMASDAIERPAGDTFTVNGANVIYEINGTDVPFTPTGVGFFDFISSNTDAVTVGDDGVLEAVAEGTSMITATLNGVPVAGVVTATVLPFLGPDVAAPEPPTRDAADVISLYSNAYTNVTVDTFRTPWSDGRTALTMETVEGDDTLKYSDLVFVGIETLAETIDTTDMTHFHFDVWIENASTPVAFSTKLVDVGPDDDIGMGGDNSDAEIIFYTAMLDPGNWQSFDIPISQFESGATVGSLSGRANIGQFLFTGNREPAPTPVTVWIDNIYFYAE